MNHFLARRFARRVPRRKAGVWLGQRAFRAAVLLSLWVGLLAAGGVSAQAPGTPTVFRHHVIFLMDASGTNAGPPGNRDEYLSVIRTKLPGLLRDSAANGFGVTIYDPDQDLTSAFAFGLSQQKPLFDPSLADGFMRRIWFQEQGKTFDDMVKAVPPLELHWTALNSAFTQSVRKARWEAEQWGVLDRAFNRTFLVMVSDGKGNASVDSLDEIREIYGAAVEESGLSVNQLQEDRKAAEAYYEGFTNQFALSSMSSDGSSQSSGTFPFGNYKILIRELRPQRTVNLGDLLEKGPDQETELGRRARGEYSGTLTLVPRKPRSDEDVSYELVDMKYRLPGQTEFQSAPGTSSDHPFVQDVKVSGDEIDRAKADFQLSFVRRDRVYGQAVQVFNQTIHFRPEPRKSVLGIIPITDLLMSLHPGLNQEWIQYLDSFLILIALVFLALVILFPAPRAEMELSGAAAGPAAPLIVTFSRSGQESGQKSLLRALRFKNTAFRTVPLLGRALPRIAERRFDVQVKVKGEFPPTIARNDPVVGLGEAMHSDHALEQQTQGSETTILLSPDALADYSGKNADPVKCDFTVEATQYGRRFWIWPFSRPLEPRKQSFYLRFAPEEPDMHARLEPRLKPNPTGTTEARSFPVKQGVTEWLILPHYQGRREEPNAVPEFDLQISNAASHVCSKTGSTKVTVVLYRADRKGKSFDVVLDDVYQDVIHVKAHQTGPVKVPIWMPYESMPPPVNVEGDDYILEATLTAADGQQWAPQTVRYGVRIGPDPRTTALSFRVGTSDHADVDFRWQAFGSPRDGAVLSVTSAPVLWNVGKVKESSVFAMIAIDNVARIGDGVLTLRLKPEAQVRPHPSVDAGLEPIYVQGEERKIVRLAQGTHSFSFGKTAEWRLENEAADRPVLLSLEFYPQAIERMERRLPKYRYLCELLFECVLSETSDAAERQFTFLLQVDFEIQRYSGEHALAIDFGTSAVVVAFEGSERMINSRQNDVSFATQRLQERYQELLKEWNASSDDELRIQFNNEVDEPNMERSSAFIPSPLLLRTGKQIGESDFVLLPVSLRYMGGSWDRIVYYLKGLILRGDEYYPYQTVSGLVPLSWKDDTGQTRRVPEDRIAVDEIIRSAYRNLFANYVGPLLEKQIKLDYLNRLVVSHPNSFTLSHIHRVRRILTETFPEFSPPHLLSESNAVAIYCARNAARHFTKVPQAGEIRHLLVYDIGAGTVDLTYTRLEWVGVAGASRLKEMKILFKTGIPVAGNRLDAALALILDEKIRSLGEQLRERDVTLTYTNPIVNPPNFEPAHYPLRMLSLKRALLKLKMEISTRSKDLFHVEISAARELLDQVVEIGGQTDDVLQATLNDLGITQRSDKETWIGIPLSRQEIFEHPEVTRWLNQITDDLIRDFSDSLKVLGVNPKIDTLILSGRTAEFPPLRERLHASILKELGLDRSQYFSPELERNEKKEAVALGSLLYAIFHGRDLLLIDQNIWARYGIIYSDGTAQRFQEFFSYASDVQLGDEETEENGMRMVFYTRTLEITRADGPIEIAATSSLDPDKDLLDPAVYLNRFQIIHTIGARLLGSAVKLKIRMRNNEDDTITVTVDPGRRERKVTVRGYRGDDHLGQMEWPYRPLER